MLATVTHDNERLKTILQNYLTAGVSEADGNFVRELYASEGYAELPTLRPDSLAEQSLLLKRCLIEALERIASQQKASALSSLAPLLENRIVHDPFDGYGYAFAAKLAGETANDLQQLAFGQLWEQYQKSFFEGFNPTMLELADTCLDGLDIVPADSPLDPYDPEKVDLEPSHSFVPELMSEQSHRLRMVRGSKEHRVELSFDTSLEGEADLRRFTARSNSWPKFEEHHLSLDLSLYPSDTARRFLLRYGDSPFSIRVVRGDGAMVDFPLRYVLEQQALMNHLHLLLAVPESWRQQSFDPMLFWNSVASMHFKAVKEA